MDKPGVQINQISLKHSAISPNFFRCCCFPLSLLQFALQPGWTQLMQQGFKGIWCLHCISSSCCGQGPSLPALHGKASSSPPCRAAPNPRRWVAVGSWCPARGGCHRAGRCPWVTPARLCWGSAPRGTLKNNHRQESRKRFAKQR